MAASLTIATSPTVSAELLVVIKTRLAQKISNWDDEIGVNTIEVYIHRLRKKLEPWGIRIRTIHGLGYLLEPYAEV